jgi:hypothetical protein
MNWLKYLSFTLNVKLGLKIAGGCIAVVIIISLLVLSLPSPPDSNVKEPIVTAQATSSDNFSSMESFINSQHRHGTTIVATDISKYISPGKSLNISEPPPLPLPVTAIANTKEDILNRSVNLPGKLQARGIVSRNGEIIFTPGS